MKLPFVMLLIPVASAYGQISNPAITKQPGARLQVGPDRTYRLIRSEANYDIDADKKLVTGSVTNTFSTLRTGIRKVTFDLAVEKVWGVTLDGKAAKWTRNGGVLEVEIPEGPTGSKHVVSVKIQGTIFSWYTPTKADPNKVGIWAEGLRAIPVSWAAPNDFTSTQITATVPNAWTVVSNGLQISDKPVGKNRHTVVWNCEQPHANYLSSIVAGPYDVLRDSWRGRPLIMTCPKRYGDRLKYTFENTRDILDYFSSVLGVDYAWTKYAQTVIYDHPYGEEDVNATIYPMYWGSVKPFRSLANNREGQHPFEWVIAHETAHQWFGDLVTCKDWGHTWLNEGITTFMEMMYTRHSRGELESLRQMEAYSQRYFGESRSYKRPIATEVFTNQGDSHTYYKGGTVMMSLRKMLGEEAFFRGFNRYLRKHQFGNVETNDLIEELTDASGINLHPWFDQWIYSPGHPVINWSWSYDASAKKVAVRVQQTQDTSGGTPIFDVPTHVGLVVGGKLVRRPLHLNTKDQTFTFDVSTSPETVLFDPDHEFVREIPSKPWKQEEMPAVFRFAPNPIDRQFAMSNLLDGNPTEEVVKMIAAELRKDITPFPAITDTSKLVDAGRVVLHDFWVAELSHPNYQRRAHAVNGLSYIAEGAADEALIRKMLRDDQPYIVVANALRRMAVTRYQSFKGLTLKLANSSPSSEVRTAALEVLANAKEPGWIEAILVTASDSNPTLLRYPGIAALKLVPADDPRVAASLRSAFQNGESPVVSVAVQVAGELKVRAVLPDLQKLKENGGPAGEIDAAVRRINGG